MSRFRDSFDPQIVNDYPVDVGHPVMWAHEDAGRALYAKRGAGTTTRVAPDFGQRAAINVSEKGVVTKFIMNDKCPTTGLPISN